MKVKKLIKLLKNMDPNAKIILQKDAEGNGYSPLEDVDPGCFYVPDSSYSGEVYAAHHSPEENCMTREEWEDLHSKPKCVVLFPVN